MPTLGTDSYVTSADYEAYASARGINADLTNLDADLIKSADFIDTYYNFKGQPVSDTQEMKLPTDQVTIAAIKKAALKAVEMQQGGLLTLDLASVSAGAVKRIMTKVDVLEKEVEYADGSQSTFKRKTPELDMLLRPFVVGGAGLVRV
jgi:hypothetical protein